MSGLEGRANLLVSLGRALKSRPEFFGIEGRPGDMIGASIPSGDHGMTHKPSASIRLPGEGSKRPNRPHRRLISYPHRRTW